MKFEKPHRKLIATALMFSTAFHAILLYVFIVSSMATSTPRITPRRLLVQSITLHSQPSVQITQRPSPPKETAPQKINHPEPIEEPPEVEPSKPADEPPAVEPSKSTQEPPTVPEKPAPSKERTSPEKVVEKPQQKKPQKAKTPQQKAPVQRTTTSKKVPPQKPKSKTSPQQTAPAYDQKLVAEALKRLDKSRSTTVHGGNASSTTTTKKVGTVGTLNVDHGVSSPTCTEDSPYDGYAKASPEAHYIADLIRRLQLNIRLPEPGEVHVTLTLSRAGIVTSVTVHKGKTEKIKKNISEKLRSIAFSSFGQSFAGESSHTFRLRLSNALLWSCGS